jgi:hypothetical protein
LGQRRLYSRGVYGGTLIMAKFLEERKLTSEKPRCTLPVNHLDAGERAAINTASNVSGAR